MVVASSGSPGSALLQDPSPDGITVHPALLRPEGRGTGRAGALRPPRPPDSYPATGRSDWITLAFLEYLLPEVLVPVLRAGRPALAHWWLTDPDHTAHRRGLGGLGDGAVAARERHPSGALDGPPGRAGPAGPDGRPAYLRPRL